MSEQFERLPKAVVEEIVNECIQKLATFGPEFVIPPNTINSITLIETTTLQGHSGLCLDESTLTFQFKLEFNTNLFRTGLEDLYLNTVYHELLHVLVNLYAVNNKKVVIDHTNKEVEELDPAWVETNMRELGGHQGL